MSFISCPVATPKWSSALSGPARRPTRGSPGVAASPARSVPKRDAPRDHGSGIRRVDCQLATHGNEAVAHVVEPGAPVRGAAVEPPAVVTHLEPQRPLSVQRDRDLPGSKRVLRSVLHGLEAAEVDRALHRLGVAPD